LDDIQKEAIKKLKKYKDLINDAKNKEGLEDP